MVKPAVPTTKRYENYDRAYADLHNHCTTKSRVIPPSRLVNRVVNNLGFRGICAVVNYDDRRYEAFAEGAAKSWLYTRNLGNAIHFLESDVLIIKGEEIPTKLGDTNFGDILVIGLEQDTHLPVKGECMETVKLAVSRGGIVGIPHGFFNSKIGRYLEQNPEMRQELMKYISFWEVHNGSSIPKANRKAADFYVNVLRKESQELGGMSFSDGHTYREIARSLTPLMMPKDYDKFKTKEDVTDALRSGILNNSVLDWEEKDGVSYRKYSLFPSAVHAGIILGMIGLSKVGVKVNKGDSAALKQG
jgi:hypothetical protein